jgi:hypothetical protein
MMKRIFAMAMFCVALCSAADAEERNLLEHKASERQVAEYLVMDQRWVTYPQYADRAGWDKLLGDCKDSVIAAGEKCLGYRWTVVRATDYLEYERSGSRVAMQNPNNANNAAFSCLLTAELAEGKGRFIDDIANGILYFCEMTSWAESAHLAAYQPSRRAIPDFRETVLELNEGDKAQMLSWTYYFLHKALDKVDPSISSRLLYELRRRELQPYLERDDYWWMALDGDSELFVNNWNPWCNANALLCYMLLENDRATLARAVYKSMVSVDRYLNYVKSDGACEEGPSYWGYAAGKLYDYLTALKAVTGGKISLFDNAMVRNMGEYIVNSYIGDNWVVNFADASARNETSPSLIYRYGEAVGSKEMKSMAASLFRQHAESLAVGMADLLREFETWRCRPLLSSWTADYKAPAFVWYPQTEFCYMRRGAAFVAAKGGFNDESHNHNDVGTFIAYCHNSPLLIDAGVGTYTRLTFSSARYTIWTMQSNYHNLPLINGIAQQCGSRYKATGTKADATHFTFSTDIAQAYPAEAAVNSWVRSYRLTDHKLLISDTFQLGQAKAANKVNFLTCGEVDVSRCGVVAIKVRGHVSLLRYDAATFAATVEQVPLTDVRLSRVWGSTLRRLTLTAKTLVRSGRYAYELEF